MSSPQPTFTTTLSILGICMTLLYSNFFIRAGAASSVYRLEISNGSRRDKVEHVIEKNAINSVFTKGLIGEYITNETVMRESYVLPKETYYSISEAHIRALHIPRDEKVKALCALRGKSSSPKYNKIGSKCDELIFEYLCRGKLHMENEQNGQA